MENDYAQTAEQQMKQRALAGAMNTTSPQPSLTLTEKIIQLLDTAVMNTAEASSTLGMVSDRLFGPTPQLANDSKDPSPFGMAEAVVMKLEYLCAQTMKVCDQSRGLNSRL